MKRSHSLSLLAVFVAAGCYAGADPAGLGEKSGTTPDQNQPLNDSGSSQDAAQTTPDGSWCAQELPDDVFKIVDSNCVGCHSGSRPKGGLSLKTYGNLLAMNESDGKPYAHAVLARMSDEEAPMPPSGLLPAADRKVIADWIAAGMPAKPCASVEPPDAAAVDAAAVDAAQADATAPDAAQLDSGAVDAGAADAGATDAGAADAGPVNEFNTPLVCTSGTTYRSGHSMRMRPGNTCINCHTSQDGPLFTAAGTVYPTAHEPDNCNGAQGAALGATVVITGADGRVTRLAVNDQGNFATQTAIALPYTAKVVVGAKERVMRSAQTNGDCNSCHSVNGSNGAPGRVMMPR